MNHNREELRRLPLGLVETTLSSGYRWCFSLFHNFDWCRVCCALKHINHTYLKVIIRQSLLRSLLKGDVNTFCIQTEMTRRLRQDRTLFSKMNDVENGQL
jgi:hypothetical protein